MDDALAGWLRLREAADGRARSQELTRAVANRLPASRPIRVLDLATGTGSNLRYLMERLPSPQHWLLVDRRRDLLELVRQRTSAWGIARGLHVVEDDGSIVVRGASVEGHVESRVVDLKLPLDEVIFADRDLVTASALLDLVSEGWLAALAATCRAVGAQALFALTYDGRSDFTPPEPEDDRVRDLLNAHQHRDKGLGGPAAGPGAATAAVRAFELSGYACRTAVADWTIGPDEPAFQQQLIAGLAAAATEQHPEEAAAVASWRLRRLAHVAAGRSRALVGHTDLAAWPRESSNSNGSGAEPREA